MQNISNIFSFFIGLKWCNQNHIIYRIGFGIHVAELGLVGWQTGKNIWSVSVLVSECAYDGVCSHMNFLSVAAHNMQYCNMVAVGCSWEPNGWKVHTCIPASAEWQRLSCDCVWTLQNQYCIATLAEHQLHCCLVIIYRTAAFCQSDRLHAMNAAFDVCKCEIVSNTVKS